MKPNLRNEYKFFLAGLLFFCIVLLAFSQYSLINVNAATGCATSGPSGGSYTVTLCFTSPVSGSTLKGNATVSISATKTSGAPSIQRIVFYLDSNYLLTDYQPAYTFVLPTTHWVDGAHSLSVEALMSTGFTTNRSSISVSFSNGITSPPVNKLSFTPALGSSPVIAVAGDGASGQTTSASVVNLISSWSPGLLIYVGDVYEKGSYTEFFNWYGTAGQNFSKFKSITDPTIGNHEYTGGSPDGYFFYWNNVPNYYSFNSQGWHIISLNANGSKIGGLGTSSPEYKWLASDLAANSVKCTIAFWHEPIYNIGPEADQTSMLTIWSLLYQKKTDIVLTGHDHDYQRWKPLDANGNVNSTSGITEFVVGSSGHGLQTFTSSDSRVAKAFDAKTTPPPYGALQLNLSPTSATYRYITIAGTVLDSGTVICH